MQITILRYGHRPERDKRTTTHCCLVARAFGAQKIEIDGTEDKKLIEGIQKTTKIWGGNFKISQAESWQKTVKTAKKNNYKIIHLTMYGSPLEKEINKIKKHKKILAIIGSHKVERQVYEEADYNIAITNQPHSEVAALAVFLYNLPNYKKTNFENAKIKITPDNSGKKIVSTKKQRSV